ncbi:hypothetical protein Bca4012_051735 [Brassica carinata]
MANEGHNQGAAQPMNVLYVLNPSKVNGSLWKMRDIIKKQSNQGATHLRMANISKFSWNHLVESEVRKMFCKCAATNLIDMISRVKERGKQPYWILDDFYKDLVAYWETDKAKEK